MWKLMGVLGVIGVTVILCTLIQDRRDTAWEKKLHKADSTANVALDQADSATRVAGQLRTAGDSLRQAGQQSVDSARRVNRALEQRLAALSVPLPLAPEVCKPWEDRVRDQAGVIADLQASNGQYEVAHQKDSLAAVKYVASIDTLTHAVDTLTSALVGLRKTIAERPKTRKDRDLLHLGPLALGFPHLDATVVVATLDSGRVQVRRQLGLAASFPIRFHLFR